MTDDTDPNGDLYRMFDENGVLLYIGLSMNVAYRASQHRAQKAWWPDVSRVEIEKHPLSVLRQEEADAIASESPLHNIALTEKPRRHQPQKRGEPSDPAAADRARRYRDRKRGGVPRELSPCGTRSAATRHRRHGEPLCDECRAAERSYIAAKQRERRNPSDSS